MECIPIDPAPAFESDVMCGPDPLIRTQPRALLGSRDLSLLCFFVVISDLAYSGLTALVVAYERALGFDLVTAGWVASAEGVGYTAGTFAAVLFSDRLRLGRRHVAGIFVFLGLAQFLSLSTVNPWMFAAMRTLAGVGAGLAYAAGIQTVSASRNAERAFTFYFGANFASGLVALVVIPPLLREVGLHGFYLWYGVALVACVGLVRWFPLPAAATAGCQVTGATRAGHPDADGRAQWPLVLSLFVNFVFNGGLWVLAEHFGLLMPGTDPASLSMLLAGTMMFGLLGTAFTALVAERLSHLTRFNLGNGGLIASVSVLASWHSVSGLIVAMALLNVSVTCLTPAGLAALARQGGRASQWGNLACQLGYSAGPAVVAGLDTHSGTPGIVGMSILAFIASSLLAWRGIRARSRP